MSNKPIVPEGGWATDNYLRCKRCFSYTPDGGKIGTIMSSVVVTIRVKKDTPSVDIATLIRCHKCNYRDSVILLPVASEYGIDKDRLLGTIAHVHAETLLTKEDFEDYDANGTKAEPFKYSPNLVHEQKELPPYLEAIKPEEQIEEEQCPF